MAENHLDEYVQAVQNIQPFNINRILPHGDVEPWFEVTQEIAGELVIREERVGYLVQTVAAQVEKWGRLAAQAKRVWQVEERKYRVWRSEVFISAKRPPVDPKEAKTWKKPSEKDVEAQYRADPEYTVIHVRIEAAEEAYDAAKAIVEGFKAQRELLRTFARQDAGGQSHSFYA